MRKMRIDPYPDAIIRQGLHKKELKETADPVLEEAMMYSAVVGMEMMKGLAMVHDAVDRSALETSERKVEVDGAIVQLCHQLGRRDNCIAIIDKWKEDVTVHMRDIREAQGGIWGWLSEAEMHLTQMQTLAVGMCQEIDLLGGVLVRQSELLDIQQQLILELDQENRWKFERIERMLDPLSHMRIAPLLFVDKIE